MRTLIASAFVSLDGVMQAPGGPEEDTDGGFDQGGWTFNYWDEMMGGVMDGYLAEPFDLLLGRRTYDIFAAHWPQVENEPVADKFNACVKYVATSTPATATWKNTQPLEGDVGQAIAKIKQGDGPNLLLQGSSRLAQALLADQLVDRFILWIFPLALGKGKRLFGAGMPPTYLKLADHKASTTGVIMATYERSEPVPPGSFALE